MIHLLGLAHTNTSKEHLCCAYSQKVLKMAQMLEKLGLPAIHYGAAGSEVPCEHVTVITREDQRQVYGDYDFGTDFYRHGANDGAYQIFNRNAAYEVKRRMSEQDILLCSFGDYQKDLAKEIGLYLTVEMGVGYRGVFADFRVFESYAWAHFIYGRYNEGARCYDAVIPNYFDLADFNFQGEKDGYLMYLGRLIPDKGVQTALDVARITEMPLVLAGQGSMEGFDTQGVDWEHVGSVGAEERNRLLGGAEALLVPTRYIEPFGGVAVEAQLCGTPAITTDWGAFPETVLHGKTGYRCRTLDDFVNAVRARKRLVPRETRQWAERNFSLERVALMYGEYFEKLTGLYKGGWYQDRGEHDGLDWLFKDYG